MGYTVSLVSTASQNEGSGGSPATFTFNLSRLAGDTTSDGDNVSFVIRNADLSVSNDFAVNTGTLATWGGGNTNTLTITALPDTTVEPNETFSVWIYRTADPTNPFYQGQVTLLNDDAGPPVFSSSTALNAAENGTTAGTIVATGTAPVTYAIIGGADAAKFALDANTGALTFLAAKNFEAPDDAGPNGVYDLVIQATGGGLTTNQNLAVTLTNVNEAVSITSGAAVGVAENNTATGYTGTATDIDAGDTKAWSISGGVDAAKFQINATTGALSFVTAPNFEAPTDTGADNTYVVDVRVTDSGGLFDTKTVTVTVANAAEGSVITSNGGGDLVLLHVQENTTAVTTVVATDDEGDARTYSIAGGADGGLFTIDATTGALTFTGAPNYEVPGDANADNVYQVIVGATSVGGPIDTQTLFVFVDNVVEPGDPVYGGGGGGGGGGSVPGATSGPDTLFGTFGPDSIAGGEGADSIDGGLGADSIDGDGGDDVIRGGEGNDFVRALDGNDDVDGGGGDDDVNGNLGQDTVHGGDGNDFVRGGQGADIVYGDDGDDVHVNGNIGDDLVYGGNGNDTVYGGQGSDTLRGDAGNDQLSGDLGNDILYGGAGADRFRIATGGGADWAADFNYAEGDRIVLAPGTAYTVTSYLGQVIISLGNGDQIGLVGVAPAAFTTDYIVFG